jgi:hypothetical protein
MTKLERELEEANSIVLTPEQEGSIDWAIANARDPEDEEVAVAASFDVANRILLIELKTGQRLAIPQEDLQDIYRARPEDLAEVEIIPTGTALHFEKAMEGIHVDAVRRGIYGSEKWMAGLAQRRRERLVKAS